MPRAPCRTPSSPDDSAGRAGLFSVDAPTLLGGRCDACGALRFPHRNICAECPGDSVAVVPLSTSGTIYTFTIVRSKPPGYLGDVPYGFGLVDLPAGLRVESGATRLGGRIPVNPSGGLLSKGEPVGASGLGQVFEIVNQLRDRCGPRQVPEARLGLTHTLGAGGNCCVLIFQGGMTPN